jgi:inner membrane protein involved in colicin E2 resistance
MITPKSSLFVFDKVNEAIITLLYIKFFITEYKKRLLLHILKYTLSALVFAFV